MKNLVPYLLSIVVLFGCQKTTDPEINNSSLLTFGEKANGRFRTLDPTPDGGFVVGQHKWKDGKRDLAIRKYDRNFNLSWERVMGSSGDDQLDKIFVAPDGRILVAGVVIGLGQDTLARSIGRNEFVYLRLWDAMGNSLWEKAHIITTAIPSSFVTQKVVDVKWDSDGNMLVVVDETRFTNLSWVLKLSNTGEMLNQYPFGFKVEGIVERDDYFLLHIFKRNAVGYAKLRKNATNPIVYSENTRVMNSMWGDFGYNGRQARIQHLTAWDGIILRDFHVFENEIFYMELDVDNYVVKGDMMEKSFSSVMASDLTHDNHLLFSLSSGMVYETDLELNIINQFQSHLNVFKSTVQYHFITKLITGDYVVGFEKERIMYITRYNAKGEIVEHE